MGARVFPPRFGRGGSDGGGAAGELEEPAEGEAGFGSGEGKGNGGEVVAGVGAGRRDLEDFTVAEEPVDLGGEAPAAIGGEAALPQGVAPAGGSGGRGEQWGVHRRTSWGAGRRDVRSCEC